MNAGQSIVTERGAVQVPFIYCDDAWSAVMARVTPDTITETK